MSSHVTKTRLCERYSYSFHVKKDTSSEHRIQLHTFHERKQQETAVVVTLNNIDRAVVLAGVNG